MDVFILSSDPDRHESFLVVDDDDAERMLDQFDGSPIADAWSPVAIEPLIEAPGDELLPTSDLPSLGSGIPVFSARAVEALADLLEGRGELLPLSYDAGEYYAFNVTRLSDALDEDRTEFRRFTDGDVMNIDRYEFSKERLAGETIFKLPQIPGMYEYVTSAFADRVKERKLTGFLLDRKVWSGDPQTESSSLR